MTKQTKLNPVSKRNGVKKTLFYNALINRIYTHKPDGYGYDLQVCWKNHVEYLMSAVFYEKDLLINPFVSVNGGMTQLFFNTE